MSGETASGTFLVTEADADSAVCSAVETGRVFALSSNPGLEAGDVVRGTLATAGPLGATWRVAEEVERWRPAVEAVDEPPGEQARSLAAGRAVGELARASVDAGRLHVLVADPERTAAAVADVTADETTRRVAARLGARRVEVRGDDGVVAVRYLLGRA